jgi:Protein of unknown function, DUF488
MVYVKRVYDRPEPTDGARLLVERLWPRGMKKEALHIALWPKEAAPSDALCRWFGHDRRSGKNSNVATLLNSIASLRPGGPFWRLHIGVTLHCSIARGIWSTTMPWR